MVPAGHRLNYALQRRVTHSFPLPQDSFDEHVDAAEGFLAAYDRHVGGLPAVALEIGAGWDMVVPLAIARGGVPCQIAIDIRTLARPELIRDSADRLHVRVAGETATELLASAGIEYRAPCDAAATGLGSGSVDLVHSTETFEHIPVPSIPGILREVARILRPNGIASFRIDYQDHYAYFDPNRQPFDFLAASPRRWRIANPSLHFQNRLRHNDYLRLIAKSPLEVVEDLHPAGDARRLPRRIHPSFDGFEGEELAIPRATVVLRRRDS